MKTNKYDYKAKANRLFKIGIVLRFLDPSGIISDIVLAAAAGNAVADVYWHPDDNAEVIEKHWPMPEEFMTEEEMESLIDHQEKIDNIKEKEEAINKEKKGGK